MSYATGQITASVTPTDDLLDELEVLLAAHEAWTFVEEVTEGGLVHRVWKNSGAFNDWGDDFFVSFSQQTNQNGAGSLFVLPFEEWDTTAKQARRGAYTPSASVTPDATYASGRGDTLDNLSHNSYFTKNIVVTTSQVDFNYWLIVTKNGAFINTDVSNYGAYGGLFEPFNPNHEQEFPLVAWVIGNGASSNSSAVTRRPGQSGASISQCFAIYSHYSTSAVWTLLEGNIPHGNVYLGDSCIGSRYAVRYHNTTGVTHRGLMYDVLVFLSNDVDPGDTITVNGDTYVYFRNNFWVNTEAP